MSFRDLLIKLLPQEDQEALRIGQNLIADFAKSQSRECPYCQWVGHPKHEGKCGRPLEYDVLSEKDICQCMSSTAPRCLVTKNLCGTDTWPVINGVLQPCECDCCSAWVLRQDRKK